MKKYISCPVTDLDSDYADYVLLTDIMSSKIFHLITMLDKNNEDIKNLEWIAKMTFRFVSFGQDPYVFKKEWNEKFADMYEKIQEENNLKGFYFPSGNQVSTYTHILRAEANLIVKKAKLLKSKTRDDLVQWFSILSLYMFNIAYKYNDNNLILDTKI